MSNYCIIMTTFGNIEDAHNAIDTILAKKLAACLQTINIGSHYSWKGSTCHDQEILVLMKTKWDLYDSLESLIKDIHPYDTPEIIAVDIEKGFKGYLDWIDETTL